jgi:hypothetical protein
MCLPRQFAVNVQLSSVKSLGENYGHLGYFAAAAAAPALLLLLLLTEFGIVII